VSETVVERKAGLRRELSERLLALPPAERRRASARVVERTLALAEVRDAASLLVCLSFGAELETASLVERLLREEREIYVPRADLRDGQLHLHRFPCELVELPFGLRQPPRGAPELDPGAVDATLDAALVLGLGFDRRGYRLGYGRGYFDRFLARRPFPAIGLALDLQLVDELPVEPHDVAMRAVVGESGVARP